MVVAVDDVQPIAANGHAARLLEFIPTVPQYGAQRLGNRVVFANRVIHVVGGSADRRKVLLEHQDVLKLTGSAERCQAVFKKHCANCHKLDDVGHDIGPNLRSLTDQKPASLLTSILDPSARPSMPNA